MPPDDLNRALARLDAALPPLFQTIRSQTEGRVWLVGGFARDLLLGRRPYDLDLAVADGARETASKLGSALSGHGFALDEERDTYRVALDKGAVRTIDVAGVRGGSIEADLALRDFTVDAMAAEIAVSRLGPLIDPYQGRADCESGTIRMVSEERLREDPLRLVRAVRLAVELGFEVEERTASSIRSLAATAGQPAAERLRDELMRVLASPRAYQGLRLLDSLGLLDVLLPEIARARGVMQPEEYHHYDVFDHSLEAVAVAGWLLSEEEVAGRRPRALRREFRNALGWYPLDDYFGASTGGQSRLVLTKLATLLHDVSKPETKAADPDGRIRFLGHSELGARVGRAICRRFRLGNKETEFVGTLIEGHLRPAQLSQRGLPTDRAIFRFFRALGDAALACLVLSLADGAAAAGPKLTLPRWRGHLAYIGYVLERGSAQTESLGGRHFISGDTLIQALGINPGPEVGRLLAALDEAAGAGEVRTEEEAVQLARQLRQRWRQEGRGNRAGVA